MSLWPPSFAIANAVLPSLARNVTSAPPREQHIDDPHVPVRRCRLSRLRGNLCRREGRRQRPADQRAALLPNIVRIMLAAFLEELAGKNIGGR